VPIHAYPVVANINCPSTLDFGMVPIGQEIEKILSFSCDVPIQFEYRPPSHQRCCAILRLLSCRYKLACLDANNDFTITPMLGIIPAEGTAQVSVLFRPTRLYTSMQKVAPVAAHRRACLSLTLARSKRFLSACRSSDSTLSRCDFVTSPYFQFVTFPRRCSCGATRCHLIRCRSRHRYVLQVLLWRRLVPSCRRWRTPVTWGPE
jgi:hypothetical protein